jgi:predicted neuraminidase
MRQSGFMVILFLMAGNFPLQAQKSLPKPPRMVVEDTSLVFDMPPFKQCHASTLVTGPGQSVRVACFAGSYEGAPDVKIWDSRLEDGHWSAPAILADGMTGDTAYPCWNPVLFNSSSDTLYLFYKVGKNPREWFARVKKSTDGGTTWGPAANLPAGILGPIRNKPVELTDGRLLCPSSRETEKDWTVHMEIYSPATGKWLITGPEPNPDWQVIQPTILNPEPSVYRILCRSKENRIVTSLSADNGLTWSPLSPIDLPNPNSGIDALTLTDGTFLLVYNPLLHGQEWNEGRNRLNLAWSADGINWADLLVLENRESGEYSYPALIQSPNGRIHLTYTYNRVNIRYVRLELAYD